MTLIAFFRGLLQDAFNLDALAQRMSEFEKFAADPNDVQAAREFYEIACANARTFAETEARTIRDALTGLYSGGYAHGRLEEELSRAKRRNSHLAVLLVDIAGLHEINEKYGFPTGDAAIRTAAAALKSVCRISDVVCRYDKDRFLVIYVDVMPEALQPMSRRAREQIESRVFGVPGGAIGLKTHAGIACSDAGSDAVALIADAEAALHASKGK